MSDTKANLQTAQEIWDASTKVFDKINEEDKKEWFNSLVDELEENKTIKWLKETWNLMNEEQKLKIYKRHSISLWTWFRYANLPTYWLWEKLYNAGKNAMSKWDNHTWKYALIEEIPCRFFVQLWILDKPQWLEDDKLKEDIKKDAKNINLYLGLCQAACLAIPDAGPEISALVGVARHYTKWYKEEWANAVIERLNNKKEDKIKKDTQKRLVKTLKAVEETKSKKGKTQKKDDKKVAKVVKMKEDKKDEVKKAA